MIYNTPYMRLFRGLIAASLMIVLVAMLDPLMVRSQEALTTRNQEQLVTNTQHIADIDRRLKDLEAQTAALLVQTAHHDVSLATITLQFEGLRESLHLIIGILIALSIGLVGRVVWDVVATSRRQRAPGDISTDG